MGARAVLAIASLGLHAATVALATGVKPPPRPPLLRPLATIPLPGVEGRIDHMALDAAGQRLFVVALGNNSVEVVDLRTGRRARSLTGFSEPQGIGFVPAPARLYITSGGDGTCAVLDAGSYGRLQTIHLGDDADNVRVDASGRHVYVGAGNGALIVLDAATGNRVGEVELSAHPEAFALDPAGDRVFVNVPESEEVAVVDPARDQVIAHWKLGDAHDNFPMALDPKSGRLFVGCRRPAVLLVLDRASGKRLAAVPIAGDVDDLFVDARARLLFASCGEGFIDILGLSAAGPLQRLGRIPTAPGARTSLLDERTGRLYVAVPHRGPQAAEVCVFEVVR